MDMTDPPPLPIPLHTVNVALILSHQLVTSQKRTLEDWLCVRPLRTAPDEHNHYRLLLRLQVQLSQITLLTPQ